MLRKRPKAAFDDMVKAGGISYLEMNAFGMVIWPILKDYEDPVGYVVYWQARHVSVLLDWKNERQFLELALLLPWDIGRAPNRDEVNELWQVATKDDQGDD